MKKTLIAITLAAAVTSSQAQGLINFFNATATVVGLISNSVDIGTTPTTLGGFKYEIYRAPAGTVNPASFVATGLFATNTASAGRLQGGASVAVPGTALGGTAALMIRGWSANLGADYATAALNVNLLGGYIGTSAIAPNVLLGGDGGSGFIPVPGIFGGSSGIVPQSASRGFSLTYVPVPEPSSMALAGLGAASLLMFRRRK